MSKARRHLFLILFILTAGFYGYHVYQFGAKSWISTMSLASCLSLVGFIHIYLQVGRRT